MRRVTKGMLAVFASSLGYGALPILAKLTLAEGVEVLPLLAWRFILGSSLVWLFVWLTRRPLPERARVPSLVALGVLYASNSVTYMLGLDRLSASLASIVFFSYPAVTVLLSRIWLGEALTSRRVVALLLATVGGVLTIGTAVGSGDALGFVWILLAVVLLAAFIVRSHTGLDGVPPVSGTATVITTTGLAICVLGAVSGGLAVPLEPRPLVLLGAIGLFSTAIPITLFLVGIQWIGPARAAIFATLEPAITLTLAALVLSERLSLVQWFGAVLIIFGVIWLRLEKSSGTDEDSPSA